MSKVYENDHSLHDKIIAGVNKLADNVASTLGPRGRNVLLQEKGKRPIVTKDGVTVAKFVDFEDPFENAGAQICLADFPSVAMTGLLVFWLLVR